MRAITFLSIGLTLTVAVLGFAVAQPAQAQPAPVKVEVVFCLDTTGSMSGLIEGAKQKIWGIANQIIAGEPKPALQIGLVGYRDYGDAYITKTYQLNEDLDAVYENLMQFSADGGGDTPEHVNKALWDAVHSIGWSSNEETLKIVFLVGDCPPHVDYDDGYDYRKVCRDAVTRDIIINTVLCGTSGETVPYWKEIARLGEGKYASIPQSGGMQEIDTPYDAELVALSSRLEDTVVAFGSRSELAKTEARKKMVKVMAPEAAAERVAYKSRDGKLGAYDLIDAIKSDSVRLEELDEEEIPEEMRKMSLSEKRKYLLKKQKERASVMEEIDNLTKKRSEYIREYMKSSSEGDSFDEAVNRILAKQAKEKGILY
jgi:hypothetical protein